MSALSPEVPNWKAPDMHLYNFAPANQRPCSLAEPLVRAAQSSIRRPQHVLSLTRSWPFADLICRRLASGVCLDAFHALALSAVKHGRESEHAASKQDRTAGLRRRRKPDQRLRNPIVLAIWEIPVAVWNINHILG